MMRVVFGMTGLNLDGLPWFQVPASVAKQEAVGGDRGAPVYD
jgi:hypothetical protein